MNRQGSSITCGGYYESKSIEIKVTRRVKEAIHIRLHSNNINRDSRIEITDALMPTIKKHNNRTTGEPCDSGPPREQITE